MTSRSILILPAHKNIRRLNSSAVAFSHAIMKKLSQHKVLRVASPLFFENKSRQNGTVYINNDNRKQKNEITINNKLTQKFNVDVDAQPNFILNTTKQIMNTTFLKKSNNIIKPHTSFQNIHNRKTVKINKQEPLINAHTSFQNIYNRETVKINKQEPLINPHTSLRNIHNRETVNSDKQEPIINNMKQTFYSLNKENNIFKTHTKKTVIEQNNLLSKTVQNLIYKSENKLEVRLQNIENKIQHLSKDIETTETKQLSTPPIQQINNKNELTNLSQKVYTLVVKQFKNEQRRKGNLYA